MRVPLSMGSGDAEAFEAIHQAIMRPMEPVLDIDADSHLSAETYGEAVIVDTVWACDERAGGAMVPARMLDTLPDWEEACGLRPVASDSEYSRRAAVAGKFRGLAGNALGDIEATAIAVMGANFEALLKVDPASVVSYWPGINPGPPGYEWSSNRAIVAVRVNQNGLSATVFRQRLAALYQALDGMLPSWQAFAIGQGSTFTVGVSIVGDALL